MHYSTKKKRWTVPWLLWRWSSLTAKQTNSAKVAHGGWRCLPATSRWLKVVAASRWKAQRKKKNPICWVLTLGAYHNLCVFYFIKDNMVFSQIWLGVCHKTLGAGRICKEKDPILIWITHDWIYSSWILLTIILVIGFFWSSIIKLDRSSMWRKYNYKYKFK